MDQREQDLRLVKDYLIKRFKSLTPRDKAVWFCIIQAARGELDEATYAEVKQAIAEQKPELEASADASRLFDPEVRNVLEAGRRLGWV